MSQLVDTGGRRLEVFSSGMEQPSVVFESGAGRTAADWDTVRSLIDPAVCTFAYSRAGQGRSDSPDPENVIFDDGQFQVASAESRTDDLVSALHVTGVNPPYVLVGYSLGGLFIRLFAQRYPEKIGGMVFVDSSHPAQVSRLTEAVHIAHIPANLKKNYLERAPSPNALIMAAAASTGPFRNIPLAVFSHDPNLPADRSKSDLPDEIQPVWDRAWSELQSELADLSDDSTHTVVKGADHMVHLFAPDAIAEAVMGMVEKSRAG